ncbi:MAG: GNAT family N-acetyltransferase [Pseudomonadota bacterium]
MTHITTHIPAPKELKRALHDSLAAAGQTLPDAQMPDFMFAITDAAGTLTAGLKGEVAFETVHVAELWVHESLRGQGIATDLLARADAHARSQGCTRIQIETRNPAAQRLYEAQGYAVFGEVPNYDGPHSLVYMIKAL